jgi:DNA modification methylase
MKQLLMTVFLLAPLSLTADYEIKEGFSIKGKIASVKSSPKFASVEKCKSFADSRSKIVGFTYDSNKKKCTLFKSVRSMAEEPGVTSGLANDS